MHEISTALPYHSVGLVKTSSFYFISGGKIVFKDTTSCQFFLRIFSLEERGDLKNYSMILLLDIAKSYLLASKILAHFFANSYRVER